MNPSVEAQLNAENVLSLVRLHSQQLQNLGVKSLDLFGSVARNEARQDSDVDFLVELEETVGFFEFFRIKNYLEDLLGCSVDLGTRDSLREHLRESVWEDLIRVFDSLEK